VAAAILVPIPLLLGSITGLVSVGLGFPIGLMILGLVIAYMVGK